MLLLKPKNITLVIFALTALIYFSNASNLEIHPFLKGEVILIPLQLLALIYVAYLRWSRR